MPDESVEKTFMVALGVCMVCSVLVSAAAVSLKGIQQENIERDRIRNILAAGDISFKDKDERGIYRKKIQPVMVDLNTGSAVPETYFNKFLNIDNFDIKMLAEHEKYGREIPDDEDIAGIKRMPGYMVIYLIKENGGIDKVILPVYGKGLWSTMYGFIALGKDLNTIKGFTIYDHRETPGLGGEVDNPRWKKIWKGKQAFDRKGNRRIEVIKGAVDMSGPDAIYRVDGLSGATSTTRGVDRMVRFWLGRRGYGPLLKRLKEERHG